MINQLDTKAIVAMYKQHNDWLIWGAPPDTRTEEEKYEDDIRMGMVRINGEQHMLNIHKGDMKAYKTGPYYSLIKPLEEVKYDKFDRWCRGMDF